MKEQGFPYMGYRGLERRRQEKPPTYLAFIVVDAAFQVKYSAVEGPKGNEARLLVCDEQAGLRPEVAELVARLIAEAGAGGSTDRRVCLLDENRSLRLSPLVGCGETLFALVVETNRNNDSLLRAASRYKLTKRQCDVLALILAGSSVSEIAEELHISENTVQGYVKTLLSKTQSRNRPAMVANVLDWNQVRAIDGEPRSNRSRL